MSTLHGLQIELSGDEMDAPWRGSREDFAGKSPEAVARKLIRDELVRMGIMPLPAENRSRGAQAIGGKR